VSPKLSKAIVKNIIDLRKTRLILAISSLSRVKIEARELCVSELCLTGSIFLKEDYLRRLLVILNRAFP
jgi:hypothetical protein